MDLVTVQLENEAFETNLIAHIDANGYLVTNSDSSVEIEETEAVDLDSGVEKEVTNEVIGQVFDTPDDAYEFYNGYAFLHGFGVRKRETYKNKTTNEEYRRKYVCNKEGFKDLKCDGSAGEGKKRRRNLRAGCEAFLRISKGKDGKWFVDVFNNAHNHELTVTPTKVMKHRSHGKFHRSLVCKSLMLELGQSGLRPYGRSRDLYIKFADVVAFDVTYMTNKFMMPFAPFVGVNHHRQSLLFAGALLENEKQETFEWLFQNFLKCMFDKHPLAIITDQDKAIGNAIKRIFRKTRHRFCSWHIKKHQIEHFRALIVRYSDIEDAYKQWIKSNTIEEFENHWEFLCGNYQFESGSWIMEMYKQHKYWAKAFLKDCFFTGMTSSGRSESIHSFFDGFVNSNTMLNEFRTVNFRISDKIDVTCSCAKFETNEILCKHIYVLKKRNVETIPDHYILPRWTLDVRYKSDNHTIVLEDTNSGNEVSALTLWLTRVMDNPISEEQSVFLANRSILYGPLVLSEVVVWLRRSKKKGLTFKGDTDKAYDSLN
ncbi:protein FAR1-RELATED SEQUENCE 5-like [Bidens hawaiensis]|uniref:protein FAR1-RELATED SEQUENCE 5-like n=1 Tax=Bidens hawaiensis TaxID=980011 RepID=UPI00404B7E10